MIILTTKCWRIGKSCTHDSRPDKSAIYHSWGRFAPHSWCIADFRIPFSSLLTRCARQVVIRRGFAGRSSFVQDFPILQHFVVRINTLLHICLRAMQSYWTQKTQLIIWIEDASLMDGWNKTYVYHPSYYIVRIVLLKLPSKKNGAKGHINKNYTLALPFVSSSSKEPMSKASAALTSPRGGIRGGGYFCW